MLSAILAFFVDLLATIRGRQQAQHDADERAAGQSLQSLGDLQGALDSQKKMAQAQANSPQSKAELDAKLRSGKF